MNSNTPPILQPRPRYGWWVLLGLVLLLTPFVLIGVGVASILTLNRDATILRREVMAATDANWQTKVQASAGWLVLGTARTVLNFIEHEHSDDARDAVSAVRRVSVGVYERTGRGEKWSRTQLFARTDARMRQRGWSRLVGVTEEGQAVLVYASDRSGSEDRLDVCIAVVDGRDMVIVSANIDTDGLIRLAERHLPEGEWRKKIGQAKLTI